MGISVGHLACFSHHILELGPVNKGAQVLDFKCESGAMWATTSATTATPGSRARSGAATSSATTSSFRDFNSDSFAKHFLAVQIAHGIVGIARGAKVDKSKAISKSNMLYLVIAKEILNIALTNV